MRDGNSSGPGGPDDSTADGDANEPASVHVLAEAGRTRLVLSGEIDAGLAAELAEASDDAVAAGLPIDVDAQHVTFMDSSGIAFLARLATRVDQPVRVLRATDSVRFLLEVTRIRELLEIVEDPDDADPAHGLPTIGPGGRKRASAPRDDSA